MKIMQVNGWLGRLSAPLLRLIQEEQPDIICIQETFELDRKTLDAFSDQYEYITFIQEQANYPHRFFAGCWEFKLAGRKVQVGNTILSRFPLSDKQEKFTHGKYHKRSIKHKGIPNTRKWQSAVVDIDGQLLRIFNYHGYLTKDDSRGDKTTLVTLESLKKAMEESDLPTIVCGDFNIAPDTEGMKSMAETGYINHTDTHKVRATLSNAHRAPEVDRLNVACDYILTNSKVGVKSFEVSEELVSDHKALILEFSL